MHYLSAMPRALLSNSEPPIVHEKITFALIFWEKGNDFVKLGEITRQWVRGM